MASEYEIVDRLIYAGTHLRNQEVEELIKEVNKITNPAILKLITISSIDWSIRRAACMRINDATFLRKFGSKKINLDHWSTAYHGWSQDRLEQLPNALKFITEE